MNAPDRQTIIAEFERAGYSIVDITTAINESVIHLRPPVYDVHKIHAAVATLGGLGWRYGCIPDTPVKSCIVVTWGKRKKNNSLSRKLWEKEREREITEKVIELARSFECCPECGSINVKAHLCNSCHTRVAVPDDAYWFAKYLEQQLRVMRR